MTHRYAFLTLLVAGLSLAPPALGQSIGFEASENCTPACLPGVASFTEDWGAGDGSQWTPDGTTPAFGITDTRQTEGTQSYNVYLDETFSAVGNVLVQFESPATSVAFTFGEVTVNDPAIVAIVAAYSALDGSEICVETVQNAAEVVIFEPGTSATCAGSDPIGSLIFEGGLVDAMSWNTVLPVELTSFDATTDAGDVVLQWRTASETNNQGFEVQVQRAGTFEPVAFVSGQGTTSEAQTYSYRVDALTPGTHSFRLKQVDLDGSFSYSPVVEARLEVPGTHVLSDVYPNPFNPTAQFTLTVAQQQDVQVAVYDLLGREVARLFDGNLQADVARSFTFEAAGLPSGIYLVRAVGETFVATQQATLLK